jgi:hypothetical protein
MKRILLGLICLLSFVSCKKEPVEVRYDLLISAEATTPPSEIADPEMRNTYETLLRDLQNDLYVFEPNAIPIYTIPQVITVVINKEVLGMNPKDIPAEDEKRIAEFNEFLPKLQEIEAAYRKRIEDLEKRDGVSFGINGMLILGRTLGDSKGVLLKEYDFELKYN